MSGDVRIIYLAGLGRSGSTLLERLLGELPGVCAVGEVVHLWQRGIVDDERCGCGEKFSECDFWPRVGQAAFGGWRSVDLARFAQLRRSVDRTRFIPALARAGMNDGRSADLAEYTAFYAHAYRSIARVSGRATVVDSSKHASLAFCLSLCPGRPPGRPPGAGQPGGRLLLDHAWFSRPEASGSYMTTYSADVGRRALECAERRAPAARQARIAGAAGALRGPGAQPRAGPVRASRGSPACRPTAGDDLPAARGDVPGAMLGPAHTASGNPMRFGTGRTAIRGTSGGARQCRGAAPGGHGYTLPLLAHYGYAWRAA